MAGLRPLQVYIFEDGNFEISVFAEQSLFSGNFRFELTRYVMFKIPCFHDYQVELEMDTLPILAFYLVALPLQLDGWWLKLEFMSERLSMPAAYHAFMSTWRPRCNLETLLSVSIVRRCTSVTGAIIGAEVVELKEEAETGRFRYLIRDFALQHLVEE
ncbi:hypothetical protein POM88_013662 [Heracleum sosnowskyi]|uniref:Uncharacterized protein n=1 Tax=Heracleum sosnowskyi TaxID=360622 RepID=A0AAD8N3I6_9APIA|nr:hypothetical protein POM88_013662 [Heracleum sosnowskyi]